MSTRSRKPKVNENQKRQGRKHSETQKEDETVPRYESYRITEEQNEESGEDNAAIEDSAVKSVTTELADTRLDLSNVPAAPSYTTDIPGYGQDNRAVSVSAISLQRSLYPPSPYSTTPTYGVQAYYSGSGPNTAYSPTASPWPNPKNVNRTAQSTASDAPSTHLQETSRVDTALGSYGSYGGFSSITRPESQFLGSGSSSTLRPAQAPDTPDNDNTIYGLERRPYNTTGSTLSYVSRGQDSGSGGTYEAFESNTDWNQQPTSYYEAHTGQSPPADPILLPDPTNPSSCKCDLRYGKENPLCGVIVWPKPSAPKDGKIISSRKDEKTKGSKSSKGKEKTSKSDQVGTQVWPSCITKMK
jgi:hypothetical protein